MTILGIESSHDDTSIAVLKDSRVIYVKTINQLEYHSTFGGTIPELAAREHAVNIAYLIDDLIKCINIHEVEWIAYTSSPGLVGSLHIGYLCAHAISLVLNRPVIPINHLIGHFYSALITHKVEYPALGLIVSGGHTQIIYLDQEDGWEIVGETLDDAIGEVYDKVGRRLGIGHPGGVHIDKLANEYVGNEYYQFTTPHTDEKFCYSYSGYKTSAINLIQKLGKELDVKRLCASFQRHICDYTLTIFANAMAHYNPRSIVLSGGVSANSYLRRHFLSLSSNAFVPDMEYTTDNGAMIAKAAEAVIIRDRNQ